MVLILDFRSLIIFLATFLKVRILVFWVLVHRLAPPLTAAPSSLAHLTALTLFVLVLLATYLATLLADAVTTDFFFDTSSFRTCWMKSVTKSVILARSGPTFQAGPVAV